jgi:hypothetical protein
MDAGNYGSMIYDYLYCDAIALLDNRMINIPECNSV